MLSDALNHQCPPVLHLLDSMLRLAPLPRLKAFERIPAVNRYVKMDDVESHKYRVEKVGSALCPDRSSSSSSL
jgi:hypothetical protein